MNAVCGIVTEADNPLVLLAALKAIEAEAQRIPGDRWAPRTLDLDILLWGSRIIREQNLIVPHPAIASRRFVLTPLAEVAPTLIHPESGMTISWLLELCKDEGSVRLWGKVVDL